LGGAPEPIAGRLLELNELQSGRAVDTDESWPQHVVESVLIVVSGVIGPSG
jgi:hypothetical protein